VINVTGLTIYPIKSTFGVDLEWTSIEKRGLQYDRRMSLFSTEHKQITGRDFPALLDVTCRIDTDCIVISAPNQVDLVIDDSAWTGDKVNVTVFDDPAVGVVANSIVCKWFKTYLNTECRLLLIDDRGQRVLPTSVGGQPGDIVSFADECPILLVSAESLDDLNGRLEHSIPMSRFRPNIVVKSGEAFSEDQWKTIVIGDTEFEVMQQCQRCVFTTIDLETKEKHPQQEPLRTLSTYRRHVDGGVAFGVHLVCRAPGTIRVGDPVIVTSRLTI
jgi:uncharacterized protein